MAQIEFEWDELKSEQNQEKHRLSFEEAKDAFLDPQRVILKDLDHSNSEERFFCLGQIGGSIVTVRFTYREGRVRIIGAGKWRKGKRVYEQENRPDEL